MTLVRLNAAAQIVAGLALATGRAPRLASTVARRLAGADHRWPGTGSGRSRTRRRKANQQVHFFKNVSMLGGLLSPRSTPTASPGVAWRARRAATRRPPRGRATSPRTARREARLAKAQLTLIAHR